jgi:hypothetical protein
MIMFITDIGVIVIQTPPYYARIDMFINLNHLFYIARNNTVSAAIFTNNN